MTDRYELELRAWADDADQHGNKYVPVSPSTLRKVAAALEAMAQDNGQSPAPTPPAGSAQQQPAQPVAWRVRDFGDDWILCHTEEEARKNGADAGCYMEPLYAAPQADRLDAERYRYWRDLALGADFDPYAEPFASLQGCTTAAEWDAAIDAARKGGE